VWQVNALLAAPCLRKECPSSFPALRPSARCGSSGVCSPTLGGLEIGASYRESEAAIACCAKARS